VMEGKKNKFTIDAPFFNVHQQQQCRKHICGKQQLTTY